MRLRYLFLAIVFLSILQNNKHLLAHGPDENIAATAIGHSNSANNDVRILAEKVYGLLMQGCSVDEVIAVISNNQEHPHNIKELATLINNLLNEKYAKDNVISLVANNAEAEEFYARKNFWKKVKISIAIGIVVSISCILYCLYHNWYREGGGQKPGEPNTSDSNQTSPSTRSLNKEQQLNDRPLTKPPLSSNTVPSKKLPDRLNKSPQPAQDTPVRSPQTSYCSDKKYQHSFLGPIVTERTYDHKLDQSTAQQIEYAKSIGLNLQEPLPNTSERPCEGDQGIGSYTFTQIEEQLEYAKSIGLEPQVPQKIKSSRKK